MVIGAISPTSFLYKWNSKETTFIAKLSYAIYLTHKGVIHMTHQLLENLKIDNNVLLLVSILFCVSVASLLNVTIEKPFMKLRNRMIDSK